MTTPRTTTAAIASPIVTLGPSGSSCLSVDPTVGEALDHLRDHDLQPDGASPAASGMPALGELSFFDGRGRALRAEVVDGVVSLVLDDEGERRGELCARIEEVFAHVRARAYRDPGILEGSDLNDPAELRPPPLPDRQPTEDPFGAFDAFLAELTGMLSYRMPPDEHRMNWWHNLFHP